MDIDTCVIVVALGCVIGAIFGLAWFLFCRPDILPRPNNLSTRNTETDYLRRIGEL